MSDERDVERDCLENLSKENLIEMLQAERRDSTRHLKRYIEFEKRMRQRILSLLHEADSEFDRQQGEVHDS